MIDNPPCITGVTDTICSVDYLRCSFPQHPAALHDARQLFGGQTRGWRKGAGGRFGFERHSRRGDIVLLHSEAGDRVCAELTGDGCREWEREQFRAGGMTWHDLFDALVTMGATFSRVDWALDDMAGVLQMDVITACVEAGCCVSRFRSIKVQQQRHPVRAELIGSSVTFGSRSSDAYVRIYDKGRWQRGSSALPAGTVRVEVEAKNDTADALVLAYIAGGPAVILRDLHARLDFKEEVPGRRDANRSRWATADWWTRFIGTGKARVTATAEPKTLAGIAAQIQVQYGAWIALLMSAPGYGPEWLSRLLLEGELRLEDKHLDLLG